MTKISQPDRPDPPVPLRRVLSLPLIFLYGLGTTLGAGIYVLIGEVAAAAGHHAPISFVVAALVCGLSGLCFGELAARHPKSAGEAIYVQEGFGRPRLSTLVGLLVALAGMVSSATIINGFVGYFHQFSASPAWLIIVVVALTLGTVAAWGIAESVAVAALFTVAEVIGLLIIIWVGARAIPESAFAANNLRTLLPPPNVSAWIGVVAGAYFAFYAFIGFEDMVNVAEEVRRPERIMPLAIILVLAVTGVLYFSVALVAVTAMPLQRLAGNPAPLAELYTFSTGSPATLISLISLVAVVNGALVQIIMAARVLYGLAGQGWIPAAFAVVNRRTRTPLRATAAVTAIVLLFALWLPLGTLAQITSFLTLVIFSVVDLALWRLKARQPAPPGVRMLPRWVPMVGFAVTALFAVYQAWLALAVVTRDFG